MKNYYVYKLYIDGEASPFYIGKGTGKRMYHHFMPYELSKPIHKSYKILKAMSSGENVLASVIKSGLTEEEAFDLEVQLIKSFGRLDNGTGILINKSDGGRGSRNIRVSKKTRKKLSAASKRRVVTENTRIAISNANSGKMVVFDSLTNDYIRISVSEYKNNRNRFLTALDIRNAKGLRPPARTNYGGWKLTQTTKDKHAKVGWNKRPDVWKLAQFYYEQYKTLKKRNAYQLGIVTGLPDSYFGAMVQRFKNGWIPSEDSLWLEWMGQQNFVI